MKVFGVLEASTPTAYRSRALGLAKTGVDGIYVRSRVPGPFNTVAEAVPHLPVGVNLPMTNATDSFRAFLDYTMSKGFSRLPDAFWTDDISTENRAGSIVAFKNGQHVLQGVRCLGGVAYRGSATFTERPDQAFRFMRAYAGSVDTAVTSGSSEEILPRPEKLEAMRRKKGSIALVARLPVAHDRIGDYAPFVDEVLLPVSSPTDKFPGLRDPRRIEHFIEAAHSFVTEEVAPK